MRNLLWSLWNQVVGNRAMHFLALTWDQFANVNNFVRITFCFCNFCDNKMKKAKENILRSLFKIQTKFFYVKNFKKFHWPIFHSTISSNTQRAFLAKFPIDRVNFSNLHDIDIDFVSRCVYTWRLFFQCDFDTGSSTRKILILEQGSKIRVFLYYYRWTGKLKRKPLWVSIFTELVCWRNGLRWYRSAYHL